MGYKDKNNKWKTIKENIDRCKKCAKYKYVQIPPCEKKHPSKHQIPKDVKLLFIGEAPPASGKYFYEDETGLRTLLFELYGIKNTSGLDAFISKGFYLLDAVKCPSKKNGKNKNPSKSVIKNCSSFLKEEIDFIKPQNICALGRSALYVSSIIFEGVKYENLERCHGKKKRIKIVKREITFMPTYFPSKRGRRWRIITKDLKKIKRRND